MSPEAILVLGALAYGLIMFLLGRWLFPKGTITLEHPQKGCSHQVRVAYEPEFSVGDESDYESRCVACGCVLRWAPNA